jgi:acetyl-CoA acetyltransferase
MSHDVVVLSAARSGIGTFGGGLSQIEPAELAGQVMKAAVERSGADPQQIASDLPGIVQHLLEIQGLKEPGDVDGLEPSQLSEQEYED